MSFGLDGGIGIGLVRGGVCGRRFTLIKIYSLKNIFLLGVALTILLSSLLIVLILIIFIIDF
jgi:hypothetical protein